MDGEITALEHLCHEAAALRRAKMQVLKTSEARRNLPPGSSRSRVTTANAKLSTACEHAERCRRRLTGAMARMLNEFGLVDESQAVKQRSLLEFERDEEAV